MALSNGVYYLALPNGNTFGYYSYLADPSFIYHFDLGYEYVYDAHDGSGGVYLYDFDSGHWWYTGRTYPFPYLYDFSLSALLYYFPDPNNPGRYSTNPRYFYNFATKQSGSLPMANTTVASGAYWLFAVAAQAPSLVWQSADGAGRHYTLDSTVASAAPYRGSPVNIGADAHGNIYVLTYLPSPNGAIPVTQNGEQMQEFASGAAGSVVPMRTITIPTYVNNFIANADGSVLVSYKGQIRRLASAATDFSQGTPFLNLWTYDASTTPAYVAADGPLAQGADGTIYCLCSTLDTALGGTFGKQTISSYAPGTSAVNTAPTTIARVDGTSIYGAGTFIDLRSIAVLNNRVYSIGTGSAGLQSFLSSIVSIPAGSNGMVAPSTAITGIGTSTMRPGGLVTDGSSIGTELGTSLVLFPATQSGPNMPLSTNTQVTSTPIYVRY